LADPLFVTKASCEKVQWNLDRFTELFPNSSSVVVKEMSDMYLYPPRYKLTGGYEADRRNWIRIRRQEGIYYIYFYSGRWTSEKSVRASIREPWFVPPRVGVYVCVALLLSVFPMLRCVTHSFTFASPSFRARTLSPLRLSTETMQTPLNVRPSFSHEINVKSISGLLSLGYQIGAVLNRRSEILYQDKDVMVSKECIKELNADYIQIKGKSRHAVLEFANKLGVTEHHIPNTFLALYFRELGKIQSQNRLSE
jgi:hypothetical protein